MQQPPPLWPFNSYHSSHYVAAYQPQPMPSTSRASLPAHVAPPSRPRPSQPSSVWYQPGSVRCTHKTCTFTGSKHSVEIHMMDRHLIFPPGWDARNKKPEWDADPSLKGKQLPIQGTNIMLNTPEALADWLAERKRRWPSAQLVAEKKRKHEEAAARGELAAEDMNRKRRRTDDERGLQRGRGRGRGRGAWRGRGRGAAPATAPVPATPLEESSSSPSDESEGDEDAPPEAVSSKQQEPVAESAPVAQAVPRPRPQQPRNPVHNSFASRPTLLRNLLLPEIRVTVSNLSQAIRFLVNNDFLQNVELKPGQANEKRIEIIDEQSAESGEISKLVK
ncbi:Nuclear fragile X mental retardation-interacting protein 1 [Mycena chlorophos]|uniref:Nuclear fragile X mental retardation-interacting protein 1 n=1 Tax=Mycena chlorophos TaxID=658473 RepID=A0A8H6T6Q1_MYCCL|nr:Nuclear fragile X mental retardation-interacting protein 1 [Mycena chlorophos]